MSGLSGIALSMLALFIVGCGGAPTPAAKAPASTVEPAAPPSTTKRIAKRPAKAPSGPRDAEMKLVRRPLTDEEKSSVAEAYALERDQAFDAAVEARQREERLSHGIYRGELAGIAKRQESAHRALTQKHAGSPMNEELQRTIEAERKAIDERAERERLASQKALDEALERAAELERKDQLRATESYEANCAALEFQTIADYVTAAPPPNG